ncbi:hypothetical protein FNU76_01670 [Chitinimonas arctica]|uniref:Uncharacterized protein n=1 Tax=Chitinimonas arctica TaxID=2594795 RepID=A0A516SAT7_9NEIS|nr:hypothetical protein [Chitinimonas arctica]QDQ25168.1 hypothetical protein FNU76_01670 [Chitinimonas arctica]
MAHATSVLVPGSGAFSASTRAFLRSGTDTLSSGWSLASERFLVLNTLAEYGGREVIWQNPLTYKPSFATPISMDGAFEGVGLRSPLVLGRAADYQQNIGKQALLGTRQKPKVRYEQNANLVVRTEEYMINRAQELGVYIPDGVRIMFVDPALLSNQVGALAEYGQTGTYQGLDLSKTMTWNGMKNINGKIPIRLNKTLLSSDEAAVAYISHEFYELAQFEQLATWNRRKFVQQTASPELGGFQDS